MAKQRVIPNPVGNETNTSFPLKGGNSVMLLRLQLFVLRTKLNGSMNLAWTPVLHLRLDYDTAVSHSHDLVINKMHCDLIGPALYSAGDTTLVWGLDQTLSSLRKGRARQTRC